MHRVDLEKVAGRTFAFRPDEAYTVDDMLAVWRRIGAEARSYERGEVVQKAGLPAEKIVFVVDGVLHCRMTSEVGEDFLLGMAMPGEYMGVDQIYCPQKFYPFDLVAYVSSEVVLLPVAPLREWRKDPRSLAFFNLVGTQLCNQIEKAQTRAAILSGTTISHRLQRYLLIRMKKDRTREIVLPCSFADLANYLGVNKCALSRTMAQLRDLGRISYQRNVITVLK